MGIEINKSNIRIRPSGIDTFYNCAYQWGKVFLEGKTTIPSARSAIGTSVHRAAEVLWNDAMATGKKDNNDTKLKDAAIEAWQEEIKEGVNFDDGENEKTAEKEILEGTDAYLGDIVPFAEIPIGVEKFYKVEIEDHPLVTEVGGTVDYITKDSISDIKTSKRKPVAANYQTQQSTYKYLAEENGETVDYNTIQGVVFKKAGAEGMILPMETNVAKAKHLINTMLDTLEYVAADTMPIELILRGNPKYYLCSPKYCTEYNTCPFVKGILPT